MRRIGILHKIYDAIKPFFSQAFCRKTKIPNFAWSFSSPLYFLYALTAKKLYVIRKLDLSWESNFSSSHIHILTSTKFSSDEFFLLFLTVFIAILRKIKSISHIVELNKLSIYSKCSFFIMFVEFLKLKVAQKKLDR